MGKITYGEFMDICTELGLQPNKLFSCFRKTMGLSQAKLAYKLDHEHITQNTISRYEHKNDIRAEYEYILWNYLVKEYNNINIKTKSGGARYVAILITMFNLYILKYATNKEAWLIQEYIYEAYEVTFAR